MNSKRNPGDRNNLVPRLTGYQLVSPVPTQLLDPVRKTRISAQNNSTLGGGPKGDMSCKESYFLFTSGSVGEGHPDKIADQISDAVLDACLVGDASSKVTCETVTKVGMVMVSGNIETRTHLDYQKIVRETINNIGYGYPNNGFDCKTGNVILAVEENSKDQSRSPVSDQHNVATQGTVFGYATDETPEGLPLTLQLSQALNTALKEARDSCGRPWLKRNTQTLITMQYANDGGAVIPLRVHSIAISADHNNITDSLEMLKETTINDIIKQVIPSVYLDDQTLYYIQLSNHCTPSHPQITTGLTGLTGRRIISDTYGGWGASSGGTISGRDPSKLDRFGTYLARWIAKSLVHSHLARRVLIQLTYTAGMVEGLSSICIDTYGTSSKSADELIRIVKANFDFRPSVLRELKLERPIYARLAREGQFTDQSLEWEKPKLLNN